MNKFEFKLFKNNNNYILFNVKNSDSILITNSQKSILENKEYSKLDNTLIKFLSIDRSTKFSNESSIGKGLLDYRFILHPSRACNLHCKYCFATDDTLGHEEITIDNAKKYIEKFIKMVQYKASKITVDLSGSGEPLLKINFIKELYEYIKLLRQKYKMEILVTFPTNGILLNQEIKNYLNTTDILYGVSLDGLQNTNDSLRLDHTGNKTFDKVLENLRGLNNRYLGIAVTLTGLHTNICEDFYGLADLHIANSINIKPVRLNESNPLSINKNNVQNILNSYLKLINKLLDNLKDENYYYINLLLHGNDYLGKFISSILRNSLIVKNCDAGIARFSSDSKGDLYACQCALGYESFKVGNINTGLDFAKIDKFKTLNVHNINKCSKCWARYICGGECLVNDIINNKPLGESIDTLCYFKKELIKFCIKFCTELKVNNNKQYSKLLYNSIKPFYYRIMDPALFCIRYLFEQKNINFDINQLREECEINENGSSPKTLKRTLEHHNFIVKEINLEEFFLKEDISTNAIVKYKKNHGYFINYYNIIVKLDELNVTLLDPIANKFIIKSKKECLDILYPGIYYIS